MLLSSVLDNVSGIIQSNPWLAPLVVFLGGLLTASNPCVLAMVPLMMGFVAGSKEETSGVLRSLLFSFVFVLGLAITFVALGMAAALAGKMYGDVSKVWSYIVAVVCLVMGLHLMEIIKIPIPRLWDKQPKTRGVVGALILGLLFGFVSAPCAAPILVVLLTYIAGAGSSLVYGGLLLLAYALGHSVLILIAGTSMGAAKKILESKKTTRVSAILRRGAGGVIVAIGLYFAYLGLKAHL